MPFYSILMIGSWVVVAGVIAYTGNWVGRRLGKQRLSLFGLRPRYTATIFTIIAGMLIAGLTIFILTRLSDEVSIALTQVGVLKKHQSELKSENAQLRREREGLKLSLSQVEQLKKKSDRDLKKAQAALVDARKKSDDLNRQITIKTKELESTTIQLSEARNDLKRVNVSLVKARKELNSASKLAIEIGKKNVQLYKENVELYTDKYLLQTRKIIYRPDQEIMRKSVSGSQTSRQIQHDLTQILARAGSIAREKGAVGVPKVGMVIVPGKIIGVGRNIGRDRILADTAMWISRNANDYVVRVMSLLNTAQGQELTVFLVLSPNDLIFRKDREIASIVLDSNMSEADILDRLVTTLKTEVRSVAISNGIIPRPDPSNEDASSIGEVRGGELLQVIEQVKKQGSAAQVRFLAAEDTWTEGPLNIRFQVTIERPVSTL